MPSGSHRVLPFLSRSKKGHGVSESRLNDYVNAAKELIAEAETVLDEREYSTWRAMVTLALVMQRSENICEGCGKPYINQGWHLENECVA